MKGTLGGIIYLAARCLGIISVADPTEATGFLQIALDYRPSATELLIKITFAG